MKNNPQDFTPDSSHGDIPTTGHLSGDQIKMIAEALTEVGEFGEVRLVIEEGRLCRVVTQTQKRFDVLDYQPGVIKNMLINAFCLVRGFYGFNYAGGLTPPPPRFFYLCVDRLDRGD